MKLIQRKRHRRMPHGGLRQRASSASSIAWHFACGVFDR